MNHAPDPYEGEEIDVIAYALGTNRRIDVLDKGFVTLVDCMPRMVPASRKTADHAVVQAARVSVGAGLKTIEEDIKTLRYMRRHVHTAPSEMVEFKFHCHMPIFVARQFIRHRTANVNEKSGRYSVMADVFHHPSECRAQSAANKQGSNGLINADSASEFLSALNAVESNAYDAYDRAVKAGMAKEQARILLTLNLYTEWYWKIDLHNLLHFLALRCDSHAQEEIRVYADAMLALITPIVPESVRAWNDYHPMRGAMLLTRMEVEAIRSFMGTVSNTYRPSAAPSIDGVDKREVDEWKAKASKLGLGPA
jgi:thymidylate synthase (FAD)